MRRLTEGQAEEHGMREIKDEIMDNGELRFRRMHRDGTGYIRTERPPGAGEWQNAHSHRSVRETYCIDRGLIYCIELRDGTLFGRFYSRGEVFTTSVGVSHNIFAFGDTVFHTVKFCGDGPGNDRQDDPELDRRSKELSEAQLKVLYQNTLQQSPTP